MTTEDERREEDDANAAKEDPSTQEMGAYVEALNRFVHQVADMDWPEQFQLDNDEKFCFSVFRTFWRQRHRQREQGRGNRRFHMRFEGPDAEEARRFMQEKFGRMFGDDAMPLDINPEGHQPDEDHVDEEAKQRKQRFQDEWE